MANESSNESSLFPGSDVEREDSGLMDILAVAAKIKGTEAEEGDSGGTDMSPGDSGLILFTAGDEPEGEGLGDDAFGSFSGGLGAGFGAEPLVTPPGATAAPSAGSSLTDASVGSAAAAASPGVAGAKPAQSNRGPLVVVALLLGLGLVGGGIMWMNNNRDEAQQQAQVEPPPTDADAAVGKAEPDPNAELAGASAGAVVAEPEPEFELEGETEGETEGLLEGETEGLGLLADGDDPMGMKEGLLESDGTNGVAKVGKWDKGKAPADKPAPVADPDPDPDPDPVVDVDPLPASGSGGKVSEEDVDCLLNPDLAKCQGGSGPAPKKGEVLAPKLPEKLSTAQLRTGFNKIKSKAKICGLKHGGPPGTKVQIHVSIEGPTGTVSSVKALGEHAGTPLGNCVEDTVKGAVFEQFKTATMGIDYPVIM